MMARKSLNAPEAGKWITPSRTAEDEIHDTKENPRTKGWKIESTKQNVPVLALGIYK